MKLPNRVCFTLCCRLKGFRKLIPKRRAPELKQLLIHNPENGFRFHRSRAYRAALGVGGLCGSILADLARDLSSFSPVLLA